MRLNSKGQVTIPADLRRKYGLEEGSEVAVIDEDGALKIVSAENADDPGKRLTRHMRGRTKGGMSTDELMELFRGE